MDSAFYFFNQGFYWMRKSDFPKSRDLHNKAGLILKRLQRGTAEQYVKVNMVSIDYYMKRTQEAYDAFVEIAKHDSCDNFLKAL